jgi:hypothetical protein
MRRIGFLGPSGGVESALREAVEFLLGDASVDQAIYLGEDDATIDRVITDWAREMFGGETGEDAFLERAVQLATTGTAAEITALLAAEQSLSRLSAIRKLPPSPARAVEMLGDRIILAVHDKSVLDEEDIANAALIVYGKAKEAEIRRFGSRYFLTPGPASAGRVAILEAEDDGNVSVGLYETSGLPVWREKMARRTSKMNVVR